MQSNTLALLARLPSTPKPDKRTLVAPLTDRTGGVLKEAEACRMMRSLPGPLSVHCDGTVTVAVMVTNDPTPVSGNSTRPGIVPLQAALIAACRPVAVSG